MEENKLTTLAESMIRFNSWKVDPTGLTEAEKETYKDIRHSYLKLLGHLQEFIPIDVGLIQGVSVKIAVTRIAASKKYADAAEKSQALLQSTDAFYREIKTRDETRVGSFLNWVFSTEESRCTVASWLLLTKAISAIANLQLKQICLLQTIFHVSSDVAAFMEKCSSPLFSLNEICQHGYPALA